MTHGTYPAAAVMHYGCFADGAMNTVPNLGTYTPLLITRMLDGKFGYSLSDSDRAAQNTAFQTRLAQNINTYITGQYVSTPVNPIVPGNLALSNSTGADTNGYYYYTSTIGGGKINVTALYALTTPKVIYVLGADVQINSNILTSGNGSVVIIAKKIGSEGGNIYVDPGVSAISATLIAEGALMNRESNS